MKSARLDAWQNLPELSLLREVSSPPKSLFYSGSWDPSLFSDCVAVVGSRQITEYGRRTLEIMIPQLIYAKKTIVSGFMYGVDQYAHNLCVSLGGRALAVLGWGINIHLEEQEEKLAHDIISNRGLILSEWDDQKPTLWTFPMRNRLVVGLSKEVIIVEAAPKSGSLITAKLAIKMKRPLLAVPGPVTSVTSAGTNALIESGQAKMWLSDQTPKNAKKDSSDPILNLVASQPLTTSEIARLLTLPVSVIGAKISILLLTGKILERAGKYYVS